MLAESWGTTRPYRALRNRGARPSCLLSLAEAEDVAVRVAEPRPPRRAHLRYVADRLQGPVLVVDECDAAFLESANDGLEVGDLEMGQGVICGARSAPED